MLKIFTYVASYRKEKSTCVNISKLLFKYLNNNFDIPIDLKFHTAADTNIINCKGCFNCFQKCNCLLNDDMDYLKLEMLNSDVIVFVTPVYFHQVPGNLKTFIDRISYWSHLLRLTGKVGININISSTNGNEFVKRYLNKVMRYLGLSVISDISFQYSEIKNHQALENIIQVIVDQIITKLKNKDFPISSEQEIYFENIKMVMSGKTDKSLEKQYWEKHDFFKYDSFRELYDNYCNINIFN